MNALDDDYESYPAHTRIPEQEILAIYAELTMNGEYDLLPYEQEWRERGPLIYHWGYQLRRRYDMGWKPSWENTDINPFFCEDSIDSSTPNVMDAVRIDDGLAVAIKATLSWTNEAPIAFLFTDGGAIEEPRNHCVPVLDTFVEDDLVYIVMPLLRAFNDPPFMAVAEVVDFVDQMIQGIEYMHEQNVAHRDITVGNIMMDASELYPEGFHPVRQNLSRNGLAEVVGLMRMHAPVRYYLIDFGSAIAFEKGTPSRDKYAEGRTGRDEDVPEFRFNNPYDPFKVDIFQFGNLLKKEFLQRYTGVEFLEPLVKEMTRPRPSERPNAKALRLRFNTVQNRLTQGQLRAHLNAIDATDAFRQRLLELGIESLLDSDPDDSPEHSSSEAPTTGNSTRSSHDSYWSGAQSMDSSVTSQSSVDQAPTTQGPLSTITSIFTRPRSSSRSTAQPVEPKQGNVPWKPAKLAKPRSPSPPPIQTAPQPIPFANESEDVGRSGRASSPKGRLRTGKFPWSRDDSPDSIGHSPILAVVNQFLQPDNLANLANRKSTIAVEDATPYNTPPKTTVRLPSPPPASPPAVKTKKAKSKKGSISDAAKDLERLEKERQEKERLEAEQRELERLEDERRELERLEREREEQERMEQERQEQERLAQEKAEQEEIERYMRQSDDFYGTEDNEFSMPGGFGSFSQPKSRLRSGSSPSATDRATSPFSMFGAARAGAATKKEPTPKAKPAAAKPSFSKPSGFAWGTKPKMSPPIDNDLATDGFSFSTSLFSSSGWKTKNEETALVPHSTLSPQSEKPSSTTSSPVTTPPVKKSGWKTKSTSYFPETKPTASSPKYEEEDLAHLKAQMEATPKASLAFGESFSAFSFTNFSVPDPAPAPEPAPVAKKATKGKFDSAPAVEPQETKVMKAKNKKATKSTTKTPFPAESTTPTPGLEEEDMWANLIVKPAQVKSVPASNNQFGDWFGTSGGDDQGDEFYEPTQSFEPHSTFMNDSWSFSPVTKETIAARVEETPAVLSPFGGKGNQTSEPAQETQEAEDDDWSRPIKGKATKGKKAKEAEAKATPPTTSTKESKWAAIVAPEEEPKEEGDDLAADLVATLDGDDAKTDVPAEPEEKLAEKEAAKNVKGNNNSNKNAKKKKGKR
ncbi:hypothetical protein FRB91_001279 [Serendipita sp. 411]|nr:hypothetical protein FRB91_001279 [Serendipita sp. 411]